MNNLTIIFITIFTFILPITAQTPNDFQMSPTKDGMIIVNNNKTQRFSFLVAGANPQWQFGDDGSLGVITQSPSYSQPIMISCVPKEDFPDDAKLSDDVEMLSLYRQLNLFKVEQTFQAKVNVDVDGKGFVKISDLTNNLIPSKMISTFYWSFIPPVPENTARSYFQTAVIGDRVLVMMTVFPETVKLEQVQKYFTQTFESIALLPAKKQTVTPKKKPVK